MPGGTVTLTANTLALNNAVTSQSVSLIPYSAEAIAVGGTGGDAAFDVPNAALSNITAQTLVIGSSLVAGGANVIAGTDISGQNFGQLTILNAGNFTNAGNMTLGLKDFTVHVAGIIASGGLYGGSAIALQSDSGSVTLTGNIAMSAGTFALSGASVSMGTSTINVGNGLVVLAPTSNVAIAVGDTTGTTAAFDVTAAQLGQITAGAVVIGNTTSTGGLTVAGNLNTSGTPGSTAGAYNLYLFNGGNVVATGETTNVGNNILGMQAGGTVNTGAITGTTVNVLAGGTLTVDGAISVNSGGSLTLMTTWK